MSCIRTAVFDAATQQEWTMPMTQSDDDKKRRDPYDPRTGATGNDTEPDEADADDDADEEVEGDGNELGG
jgi:hypothetical protein